MVGLDLLGSLLPMAGAGASGFMEGQQQAIAANQAKQEMYLREQQEKRTQKLFPKQLRALDNEARAADQDYEYNSQINPLKVKAAGLPLRENESGLNPILAELTKEGMDPNLFAQMKQPEQIDYLTSMLGLNAGITKAKISKTPTPSNDPTKRLRDLEAKYNKLLERPPKNINEVIVAMDDQMRSAARSTGAFSSIQAAMAYYKREIESERGRLGLTKNEIAPTQDADDVIDRAMEQWLMNQ